MKIRAAVEAAKDCGILVMARTDCRPTAGIDEAVARIEMYVEEGADILFLDSPPTRRRCAAPSPQPRAGRPSPCSRPGRRARRRRRPRAAELGLKIGTYPDRHALAGHRRHEGRARRAQGRQGGGRRARCRRPSSAPRSAMPTTTRRRSPTFCRVEHQGAGSTRRPLINPLERPAHQHRPVTVGQPIGDAEGVDPLRIRQQTHRPCPVRPPQAALEPVGIENARERVPDILVRERLVRERAGA